MKIVVLCNECGGEKEIKDAVFNPLGGLRLKVEDCINDCDSCDSCSQTDELQSEIESLESRISELEDIEAELATSIESCNEKDIEIERLNSIIENFGPDAN